MPTTKKTTTASTAKKSSKARTVTLPAELVERIAAHATLRNIAWHREKARDLREEARPNEKEMLRVAAEHEAMVALFNEVRAARGR